MGLPCCNAVLYSSFLLLFTVSFYWSDRCSTDSCTWLHTLTHHTCRHSTLAHLKETQKL
jgi:hypothetical protein